jgi:hypothetical protein
MHKNLRMIYLRNVVFTFGCNSYSGESYDWMIRTFGKIFDGSIFCLRGSASVSRLRQSYSNSALRRKFHSE